MNEIPGRRLKGRCFYCGRKQVKGVTCLSCRPLLQLDPLYAPSARTKESDAD